MRRILLLILPTRYIWNIYAFLNVRPTCLYQVVTNACATQAILSVLLNTPGLELGETVDELKSFSQDFPPEVGIVLVYSACGCIRAYGGGYAKV